MLETSGLIHIGLAPWILSTCSSSSGSVHVTNSAHLQAPATADGRLTCSELVSSMAGTITWKRRRRWCLVLAHTLFRVAAAGRCRSDAIMMSRVGKSIISRLSRTAIRSESTMLESIPAQPRASTTSSTLAIFSARERTSDLVFRNPSLAASTARRVCSYDSSHASVRWYESGGIVNCSACEMQRTGSSRHSSYLTRWTSRPSSSSMTSRLRRRRP
mmetsp:Transcript_12024/g.27938  ORF Transcript_12024/g.27938 Transcript_12024/m.27938 type:complete len:216 (-) Transcript_12024:196-843(-)